MNRWVEDTVKECQEQLQRRFAEFANKSIACIARKPIAWGYFGTSSERSAILVHALVRDAEAPHNRAIPACMRSSPVSGDIEADNSTDDDKKAIGWGYPLCGKCAYLLPASWRVKAGHGPYDRRKMVISETALFTRRASQDTQQHE